MPELADIEGDDVAMLARLAAMDLAAAEHAHAKLMQAEEPGDIAELGRTYQRLARSLRQTLILKAKVGKERAADEQAAERRAAEARRRPYDNHESRIDIRLEPLIEEACEHLEDEDDYEVALEMLHDRAAAVIWELKSEPGFLDTSADAHAGRVCARLGLKAPPSDPPPAPASRVPDRDAAPERDHWSSA